MRAILILMITVLSSQRGAAPATANDPVRAIVGRLDLEKYKATIKGLTQFGDRRQGTERNRKAVDWIEAQLKSYGCSNVERLKYDYAPNPNAQRGTDEGDAAGGGGGARGAGQRGANAAPQRGQAA